jgi:hypothetical protein
MNGIEKQAVFYRGYLIDDRSLIPLMRALAAIVGLWLLVYMVGPVDPHAKPQTTQHAAHAPALASRSP